MTVDDHTSLESLVRGSLGLDGIAKLTSEIASRTGQEVRFDACVEETGAFELTAPRCGQQLIALFQLQDVYDFRLEDNRWFQGSGWSKTIRVWRDEIYDMSPPPEPDPTCGCRPQEDPDSFDGVVLLTLDNLRVLLGYREDADGTSFPTLRAACPAGIEVLLGADIELARGLVPSHLVFLSDLRGETLVGRLGPCFPAGARYAERERLRIRSVSEDEDPTGRERRVERRRAARTNDSSHALVRAGTGGLTRVFQARLVDVSLTGARIVSGRLPAGTGLELHVEEGTFSGLRSRIILLDSEPSSDAASWSHRVEFSGPPLLGTSPPEDEESH